MGQEPSPPCHSANEEHIGFWSFDIASGLSFMDPLISEMFGIDPTDGVRGVGCERTTVRIHPDDRIASVRETERAIEQSDFFSWRYQLEAPDGSYQSMHALGRCFQDAAGRPTHIAGVLMRVKLPEPKPVEIEVIEGLARLRELAKLSRDTMLPRLIEAVMLHAGRELAKMIGYRDR